MSRNTYFLKCQKGAGTPTPINPYSLVKRINPSPIKDKARGFEPRYRGNRAAVTFLLNILMFKIRVSLVLALRMRLVQ